MRQTASGRWMPDKPEPEPDRDDTGVAAVCRAAITAGVVLPWWYPLMHFQAAVGRAALEHEQ